MPIRTCAGCRSKKEKSLLVRLIHVNGVAVIDDGAIKSGRGAYVCRCIECIDIVASDSGRLSRAFRKETEAPGADTFRKRLGL